MEILIFIILVLLFFFIYKNNKSKFFVKPSHVKKDEIIKDYEKQMLLLLKENENDLIKQKEEKIKLIKRINQELSMNLFFDENEVKEIISKLLKL